MTDSLEFDFVIQTLFEGEVREEDMNSNIIATFNPSEDKMGNVFQHCRSPSGVVSRMIQVMFHMDIGRDILLELWHGLKPDSMFGKGK